MKQPATWSSIIARLLLLILLVGSLYGIFYPDHLGMAKSTAQIVNAVYLSATFIVHILEGKGK